LSPPKKYPARGQGHRPLERHQAELNACLNQATYARLTKALRAEAL